MIQNPRGKLKDQLVESFADKLRFSLEVVRETKLELSLGEREV